MSIRTFSKMHGLGNDFIVLNALHEPFDWPREKILALADRERLGGYGGYSVDSDGTATLSGSHKVRGIGDCWSGESHVWDGKRFVLQNRSGDTQCKSFAGGAWNMPSYLARVLPPK